MLKFASKLSDDNEYALIWIGQSLATPNGLISDATVVEDALITRSAGQDIVLVGPIAGTGTETVLATNSSGGALTAGAYIGAEVRVGRPTTPGVGYGTVSANTATTVTITWVQDNLELATDTVTIVSTGLVATVTALAHGLPTGTVVTIAGANEPDYNGAFAITVATVDTYTYTMLADPVDTATGTITSVPFSVPSYIHYRDSRHKTYPNVRVLQAFLPETVAAYPTYQTATPVPGYTIPAAVTSYADVGVFLPFTFIEGISSYGISNVAGGGAATAAAATTFTWTTANTVNVFAGAFIRVRHDGGVSWATVASNTATVATLDATGWLGIAYDAGVWGTASGWSYDIWLPHWFNNPHALTPGPGFLHPTNESQPLAAVLNRPRGATSLGWDKRWGAMLSYAWRVSQAIGKRVNVIPLAVDASYMISNVGTFGGATHGWMSPTVALDWNPSTSGALAARLQALLTMADAANDADGNTKPLKIIGIANMQGESEATSVMGRDQYANALANFYRWLQGLIDDLGLSYFTSASTIPITHPNITKSPWEIAAAAGGGGDTDRVVNIAISSVAAKLPYASTFALDDDGLIGGDGLHLNGEGEAVAGRRHARNFTANFDDALSVIDDPADPIVLDICKLALSYLGESARITSLDPAVDPSVEAAHCARVYAQARNMLLQRNSWSFATRRGLLERVEDVRNEEWSYAYGLPNNCVRLFAVLPDDAGDDISISAESTGIIRDSSGSYRDRGRPASRYVPRPFTVEQDDDGYQVIYTDVEDAVGRWNVLVSSAAQFSPQFKNALSYKMAAMLSGPIIKGEEGARLALQMTAMMERELGEARVHNAVEHSVHPVQVVSWIAARR